MNTACYEDSLIRLDELSGDMITVPALLAKRAQDFHDKRVCVGIGLIRCFEIGKELPADLTEVRKDYLTDYLIEASAEPCHCGSGKRYERCHSSEELPEIVNKILGMNQK